MVKSTKSQRLTWDLQKDFSWYKDTCFQPGSSEHSYVGLSEHAKSCGMRYYLPSWLTNFKLYCRGRMTIGLQLRTKKRIQWSRPCRLRSNCHKDKMNTLEGSLSHINKDQHTNLTCRKCKKKGHMVKVCPNKKDGSEKKEGKANKDSKKTGLVISPCRIPPKDNDLMTKKIKDVEYAWCNQCKWWMKCEK